MQIKSKLISIIVLSVHIFWTRPSNSSEISKKWPLDNSFVECRNIDFISDNELNIKIDKKLCETDQSALECLNSTLTIPEKLTTATLIYSIRNIQNLLKELQISKNLNIAASKKLTCYSKILNSLVTNKEFSKINTDQLFMEYLPVLFTTVSKSDIPKFADVWSPYLLDKASSGNLFLNLEKISDQKYISFLTSYYLRPSYFKGLTYTEKYKLSLDLLRNSLKTNIEIPASLKEAVINYLNQRAIGSDFPEEIIIQFKNDPAFKKVYSKIFDLKKSNSKEAFSAYSTNLYRYLLTSPETAMNTRCTLAEKYLVALKENYPIDLNEKNENLKEILRINLPCIQSSKKDFLIYLSTSTEFVQKWCPKNQNCLLHFINEEWLQQYAYCEQDSDCRTLKYDDCQRIFFNNQLPKKEIQLYHDFCQNLPDSEKIRNGISNNKSACLDNRCQLKRY